MNVSPQLLGFIGSIYDCVIEPQRWTETADALRLHLRMQNVVMAVNRLQKGNGAVDIAVTSGIPAEFWPLIHIHGEAVLKLWGGPARIARVPLEEPVIQSRMTDRKLWVTNDYFRHFIEPQGLIDAVAVALARDPMTIATIAFGRHGDEGPVVETELDDLRVLAPHIRRATAITGLLDDAVLKASTFASALEASASGILLVDRQMGIVHANAAAAGMLAAGDPVQAQAGVLSLRAELVPGQLEAAVEAAGADDAQGRRGLGIPGRWRDGTPCVLHILPLERREVRVGLQLRATAAIFISEAPRSGRLPLDAVSLLYSLTPAEARVFELLVEGHPPAAIAAQLGSTTNTVRTHLKRVFDKTNCHRQADLVALARNVSLPA